MNYPVNKDNVLKALYTLGYDVYLGQAEPETADLNRDGEMNPYEVAEGRYQVIARVYDDNYKYGKNGVPITFYVNYNNVRHVLCRGRVEYPEDLNYIAHGIVTRAENFFKEQELIENGHDVSGLRIFEDNNKTFPKFQKKYITDDEAVRMLADLLEYKTKVLANIAEAEANLRTIVKKVCDKS